MNSQTRSKPSDNDNPEELKQMEEFVRERIPILEKQKKDSEDYHQFMLKQWGTFAVVVFLWGVVFTVIYVVLVPKPRIDPSEIAKAIFDPSLTVNALFIGFVPLIGTFYLDEIRETQEEYEKKIQERTKILGETEEHFKFHMLIHDIWVNISIGIKRYIRIYLLLSIVSLLLLVVLYIGLLGLSSALFVFADAIILLIISTGVYPIVQVALDKSVRKSTDQLNFPHRA